MAKKDKAEKGKAKVKIQKIHKPKKGRAVKKAKAKTWYDIHSPEVFNKENVVGHTVSQDPEKLIGRTLEIKLSQLVGDMRKSDKKITIKINEVKGIDAFTTIVKYSLSRISLMRLIRRKTSKIESVDDLETKDKRLIRIKTLVITKGKAPENQRRKIKNGLTKAMTAHVSKNTMESLILAIVSKQIQKEFYKELRQIYPLIAVEVRSVEIKPEKKTTGEHKDLASDEPVEEQA